LFVRAYALHQEGKRETRHAARLLEIPTRTEAPEIGNPTVPEPDVTKEV